VVSVVTAQYIASGIEPNLSGWMVPSNQCISDAAVTTRPAMITPEANSARRSDATALNSELMPAE